MSLPTANPEWLYTHQRYARKLLTEQSRDEIETMLVDSEKFHGPEGTADMRMILNHEMKSMKAGVELVMPKSLRENVDRHSMTEFEKFKAEMDHRQVFFEQYKQLAGVAS